MTAASYWFERFCFLSFAAPCFYMALLKPGYYHHLTYWTMMVHTVYFTIDKSSPHSWAATWLLHGVSFCGAFAVLFAYAVICIFGSNYWGSWLVWENAIGAYAGTVQRPRPLYETLAQKLLEHAWPVVAILVDTALSRAELKRIYAGWRPKVALALGMGSYFAYATIWENCMAKGGAGGDTLTVYQQPAYLRTSQLLERYGGFDATWAEEHGLAEDLLFVIAQKVFATSSTVCCYLMFLTPLIGVGAKKAKRA
tara:strand:- start:2323 stop:3081 length:759 start_codon:yes stop_codon:yes gene_type:complete